MEIKWKIVDKETVAGCLLAIVFCTVVAKLWMVPWLTWWEVLWVVLKSQVCL